ncbi:hypothetical protein V3C99_004710, partial [Haemonchus contortus]
GTTLLQYRLTWKGLTMGCEKETLFPRETPYQTWLTRNGAHIREASQTEKW